MFAGKTATLIGRLQDARTRGLRVRAFKHTIDTRYAAGRLATHDGRCFDATLAASAADLLAQAAEGATDVCGVDEAQFFGRELAPVCTALRARGLLLIVAGIHNDAWGRPFAPFPQLIAAADRVDVLRAACRDCGAPAEYSQRLTPVADEFMIGGLGEYAPKCSACFEPLPAPAPPY